MCAEVLAANIATDSLAGIAASYLYKHTTQLLTGQNIK